MPDIPDSDAGIEVATDADDSGCSSGTGATCAAAFWKKTVMRSAAPTHDDFMKCPFLFKATRSRTCRRSIRIPPRTPAQNAPTGTEFLSLDRVAPGLYI